MYKYLVIGKKTNYCIILTVFLYCFLLYAQPLFAKTITESLTVSPIINTVVLKPDQITQFPLTVTNNADIALGIHMNISGFDENDQTGIALFQGKDSPMIGWTKAAPTDTVIAPNEKATIIVRIKPPKYLKQGGYYATIFLTPFIAKPQNALGPIILSRIGILVLGTYGTINYENLSQKVQVTHFSVDSLLQNQPTTSVYFTVRNTYFAYFTAKPSLTLSPLFGKTIQYQLDEKHILPTKSKVWHTSIMIPSLFMVYKAQLATSVGQGHYIYSNTFFLVAPEVITVLCVLCLLLCIILFILLRKRLVKSGRLLIKGR
jgi:hypothetical protein